MNRILVSAILLALLFACSQSKKQMLQNKTSMDIEIIKRQNARSIPVAPQFQILEYGSLGNGITNGSVARVEGRYPEKGWGRNTLSDELVYVIAGTGYIETPERRIPLSAEDIAFIPKGQKIAWKGEGLKIFIPCIPAWTPQQHELLENLE